MNDVEENAQLCLKRDFKSKPIEEVYTPLVQRSAKIAFLKLFDAAKGDAVKNNILHP